MIDVNQLVPLLTKTGLTADEFLILHLKYMNNKKLLRMYKNTFQKNGKGVFTIAQRDNVVRLGYMAKDETDEKESYYLTDKFRELYGDEYTIGNELWDLYPAFTKIDGKNAPLMKVDKTLFRSLYYDTIQGLLAEHEEVMLDTQYAIEHNMISIKIVDYVRSEMWTKIRKIRTDSSPITKVTDTYEF